MSVKYQFFAQDTSGDHNFERDFSSREAAIQQFRYMRDDDRGYWVDDDNGEVFVPWHRIDFIRIIKIEDEE